MDVNNGMTGPFTGFSPAYNKVKEQYKYSLLRAAKMSKGIATQRRMGNFDFDSIYKHVSDQLDFQYDSVQGFLYKRIENEKIYHSSAFHKKFYRISFPESQLLVFDD